VKYKLKIAQNKSELSDEKSMVETSFHNDISKRLVLYVNAYNYVSQYASCDLHWEHDNKTIPQIIKMFRKYSVMTNYFYRFLLYYTLKGGCANELCKSGFY